MEDSIGDLRCTTVLVVSACTLGMVYGGGLRHGVVSFESCCVGPSGGELPSPLLGVGFGWLLCRVSMKFCGGYYRSRRYTFRCPMTGSSHIPTSSAYYGCAWASKCCFEPRTHACMHVVVDIVASQIVGLMNGGKIDRRQDYVYASAGFVLAWVMAKSCII